MANQNLTPGLMIVLSDIAASTLGIALLVMVIIYSLPQKQERQDVFSSEDEHEITETFKLITSKPLSPVVMVETLFARTAGTPKVSRSIDVFSNRLSLITTGLDTPLERHTFFRSHTNFLADIEEVLKSNIWRREPVSLYVFDNQLYNLIHDLLEGSNAEITTLNIPRALTVTDNKGRREWHPVFDDITRQTLSFDDFQEQLLLLLQRKDNGADGGGGVKGGQGAIANEKTIYKSLTTRLWKSVKALMIFSIFFFAGLIILKTERRFS